MLDKKQMPLASMGYFLYIVVFSFPISSVLFVSTGGGALPRLVNVFGELLLNLFTLFLFCNVMHLTANCTKDIHSPGFPLHQEALLVQFVLCRP